MTDLQRLIEWHESERETYISARDNPYNSRDASAAYKQCARNHAETARILRTLADVRRKCSHVFDTVITIEDEDGVEREGRLLLKGPAEPLRRLVELLGGGK